jgi:PEP-CTERM motif
MKTPLLAIATTLLSGTLFPHLPAAALTWTVNGTVSTTTPISGSFTLDSELAPSPNVTFSNVTINSLIFTAADVVGVSGGGSGGITAIDWAKGLNSLALVFASPLTPAGGTVLLDDVVSDFDGGAIAGSVTGTSSPVGVPEPSTLLGLLALGGLGALMKRG